MKIWEEMREWKCMRNEIWEKEKYRGKANEKCILVIL